MARRSLWSRLALALSALLLVAVATLAAAAWSWLDRPLQLAGSKAQLSIGGGATPRDVAQGWVAAGVQTHPRLLYEWFRWSGQARSIRAGSYEIDGTTSPRALLAKMVRGNETMEQVVILEGWTLRQLRAALARAPYLRPDTANLSDAELMAALGAPTLTAEGRFFPDTYAYNRGASDLTVLRRAHEVLQARLADVWAERPADTPLRSSAEALTLASIIEKETGRAGDRGLVGGVFINRLRIGMALQSDPTIIYGLGQTFDGNLRKRDLRADTPYNTYTRRGLPPTPIALPGIAALQAAVRPQATKALYFVASGSGGSVFSETLAEHNRAVNKFQRGGR